MRRLPLLVHISIWGALQAPAAAFGALTGFMVSTPQRIARAVLCGNLHVSGLLPLPRKLPIRRASSAAMGFLCDDESARACAFQFGIMMMSGHKLEAIPVIQLACTAAARAKYEETAGHCGLSLVASSATRKEQLFVRHGGRVSEHACRVAACLLRKHDAALPGLVLQLCCCFRSAAPCI